MKIQGRITAVKGDKDKPKFTLDNNKTYSVWLDPARMSEEEIEAYQGLKAGDGVEFEYIDKEAENKFTHKPITFHNITGLALVENPAPPAADTPKDNPKSSNRMDTGYKDSPEAQAARMKSMVLAYVKDIDVAMIRHDGVGLSRDQYKDTFNFFMELVK